MEWSFLAHSLQFDLCVILGVVGVGHGFARFITCRYIRHHFEVEVVGVCEVHSGCEAIFAEAGQPEFFSNRQQDSFQREGHLLPEHLHRFGNGWDNGLANGLSKCANTSFIPAPAPQPLPLLETKQAHLLENLSYRTLNNRHTNEGTYL
jgi:hypothetical protein